jgi:hypothetical protein
MHIRKYSIGGKRIFPSIIFPTSRFSIHCTKASWTWELCCTNPYQYASLLLLLVSHRIRLVKKSRGVTNSRPWRRTFIVLPSRSRARKISLYSVSVRVGCGLIIRKDHAKFEQKIMQIQSGSSSVDSFGQHDHPSPTDVVFMNDAHRPSWTQMTLESTYLLFWHLLADPAVSTFFRGVDQSQNDFDADKTEEIGLTTAPLSFLQQPLFDMLRVYFSGEKQNNLMLVVDIWLLYLQPWSLKHSQDAGPDRVRCVDDAYTKEWKYYVAANLHIYTTLLTCFLRFVSRMCHNWDTLDSGSGTAAIDGHIVFNALLKVLKVLSFKPLRQDILSLQEDARNRYSTCSRNIQQQQRMQMIESDIPFISPRITARNSPGRSRKFSTEAHTGDIFISGVIRQHQLLFPDSKIDDLPNMGLGDAVSDNKEYADRIIRMLHTLHAKADVGYLSYVWQLLADCGAEIGKIL